MSNAEKTVKLVEQLIGPVSIATLIAAIAIIVMIAYWIYTKAYPMFSKRVDTSVSKKIKQDSEEKTLKTLSETQETQEKKIDEMSNQVRDMSDGVKQLTSQLSDIMGAQKTTMSVLLDVLDCMKSSTDPEECANKAQTKITNYLLNGKYPVQ